MTNTQAQHHQNAGHHYAQALHTGLEHAYEAAHQAALDALHTEALAEDTAREAEAHADAIWAEPVTLDEALDALLLHAARKGNHRRADWLDDQLISGMFTAMTHQEIHDEYGLQEALIVTGDYRDMFDLR